MMLVFTSCYTDKKARKSIIKAHANKPQITANLCSEFYPVKDSIVIEEKIIKGDNDTLFMFSTDTFIDTVTNIRTIDNKIYKTIYRTDTVYKSIFKTKESNSKISRLNHQLKECDINKNLYLNRLKDSNKSKRNWLFISLTLMCLYITKVLITKKI